MRHFYTWLLNSQPFRAIFGNIKIMLGHVKGMLRPFLSRIKSNVMTSVGKLLIFIFSKQLWWGYWRQNEPFWIFEYLNFEKIFGEFRFFKPKNSRISFYAVVFLWWFLRGLNGVILRYYYVIMIQVFYYESSSFTIDHEIAPWASEEFHQPLPSSLLELLPTR